MITVLAKLVAYDEDNLGYITYVFQCLEEYDSKYIMCVRYPNWNHKRILLGEVGYLAFEEIKAGIDTWYNGNKMIHYKYNAIQFLKFVSKPEKIEYEYIM